MNSGERPSAGDLVIVMAGPWKHHVGYYDRDEGALAVLHVHGTTRASSLPRLVVVRVKSLRKASPAEIEAWFAAEPSGSVQGASLEAPRASA